MLPFFVVGTVLSVVGIGVILFREKIGSYYARYYQRTERFQWRSQKLIALVGGLVVLGMGYYQAYLGYPHSLLLIAGGILAVLFCKELASHTVAVAVSPKAQARSVLMVGCAATGMGMLMLLQGIMLLL